MSKRDLSFFNTLVKSPELEKSSPIELSPSTTPLGTMVQNLIEKEEDKKTTKKKNTNATAQEKFKKRQFKIPYAKTQMQQRKKNPRKKIKNPYAKKKKQDNRPFTQGVVLYIFQIK